MANTTSVKYKLEGIPNNWKDNPHLKSQAKYICIYSHKDIQWCKKMAKKSYYQNNYTKMRIRKVTSEVVWKADK